MLSNDKPKQNAGIFDEKGRLITKKYGNSTSVLNREGPVNPVGVEERWYIWDQLRVTIYMYTRDHKCN